MNDIEYGLISITGKDAAKFLQGQLTCDVLHIEDNTLQLGAHCNPQGRIVSLFHLFHTNGDFFLLMPHNLTDITLTTLKKYAVFYKVNCQDVSKEINKFALPIKDLNLFHQHLIQTGIPFLYLETSGKFLPHELNLHLHGAINFEKGCYTGQEIIARMHYRGNLKKQLYKATLNTQAPLKPGTSIAFNTGKKKEICGEIVDLHLLSAKDHHYFLLVLCEQNAIKHQLFVENYEQDYIMIKNEA